MEIFGADGSCLGFLSETRELEDWSKVLLIMRSPFKPLCMESPLARFGLSLYEGWLDRGGLLEEDLDSWISLKMDSEPSLIAAGAVKVESVSMAWSGISGSLISSRSTSLIGGQIV